MALHIPAFLNYNCLACGACCRDYEISVTDDEHEKLSRVDWHKMDSEIDVDEVFTRAMAATKGARHCINLRDDGTCAFLASDARCIIHKHLGHDAKSLTCRLFPVTLIKSPTGWYAGGRFNCRAFAEGKGPPFEESRPQLRRLCKELEGSKRIVTLGDTVRFDSRQTLPWLDYMRAERTIVNLLLRPDLPLLMRVAGAWRVVDLMRQATLAKVGGDRFGEFMDLITAGVVQEMEEDGLPTRRPGPMQRWMFHQFLFLLHRRYGAHAGAVGFFGRLKLRYIGLRSALRFGLRRGRVKLFRDKDPVALREVYNVWLPPLDHTCEAALERYLAAKLFAKHMFGPFFSGYSFLRGFTALMCGFGAILWFARAHALADGRDTVAPNDVIESIRHVDFSLGHSPALAMRAEKVRMDWLGREDTPVQLIMWQMGEDG